MRVGTCVEEGVERKGGWPRGHRGIDHQCRNPPRTADMWVGACTGDTRPKRRVRGGRGGRRTLLWAFGLLLGVLLRWGGSLRRVVPVSNEPTLRVKYSNETRWNTLLNLIGCFNWCTVFGYWVDRSGRAVQYYQYYYKGGCYGAMGNVAGYYLQRGRIRHRLPLAHAATAFRHFPLFV